MCAVIFFGRKGKERETEVKHVDVVWFLLVIDILTAFVLLFFG